MYQLISYKLFFNSFCYQLKEFLNKEVILDFYDAEENSNGNKNLGVIPNISIIYADRILNSKTDIQLYIKQRLDAEKNKYNLPLIVGSFNNFRGGKYKEADSNPTTKQAYVEIDDKKYFFLPNNKTADLSFVIVDNNFERCTQLIQAVDLFIQLKRIIVVSGLNSKLKAGDDTLFRTSWLEFIENDNINWEGGKEENDVLSQDNWVKFSFTKEVTLSYLLIENNSIDDNFRNLIIRDPYIL